jgi:sugar O-acyltransferase (sialic acid O-acetyltransferase NeuD family)
MKTSLIIIGAGRHAISVTNVVISMGMSIVAFVDDNKAGTKIFGIPVISKQKCLNDCPTNNFAIAIGDNAVREQIFKEYLADFPNMYFPPLVHTSSVVGYGAIIGNGTILMPLVNVGPNSKVGDFCILNSSSSIDHDCAMESYSSIAPRVVCGGNVKIGVRSAVSIGATVKDGILLGDDVIIGANSYVNKAVADKVVAYGTPCKKVRARIKGDPYLS